MGPFIINSEKTEILPIKGIKLDKDIVLDLYTIRVDTDGSTYASVYATKDKGAAELVFEDISRQLASGPTLIRVCEPEDQRMVRLSIDQIDYLLDLVEADQDKHEANTEGDYHLRQIQEKTMDILGRYSL